MAAYRGRANSITYDGQSLLLAPSGGPFAPDYVAAALVHPFRSVNTAVLGTTYTQRSVDVATRTDIYVAKVGGVRNYVDCGGSSDLANGATSTALIAAAETYWNARKTAGFNKVVVCTVPPAAIIMGGAETQRVAYNIAVRASAVPNALADLAADSRLQDINDATYFQTIDKTHPTAAGAQVVASLIAAALATVGVS